MRLRAFALFGLALLVAMTAFPKQARAADLTVTNTGDSSRATPALVSTPTIAIQKIRGIEGEVVTADVVFSNPTGSGFSGIGMVMAVEDLDIAEFVGLQFPEWIDPLFAGLLMDMFIAPEGFPTSSITLVVPDMLEQIEGVVTDEVLATISLRLTDIGRTRLLLDVFQLDDDDPYGPILGDLTSITKTPIYVTTTVSGCALDIDLRYKNGALTMQFELGTAEPAIWSIWLMASGQLIPLRSAPASAVVPQISFYASMPLPPLGKIWLLTALTTAEGAPCFTYDTVNTGTPSSSTPSIEALQELFPTPTTTPPNN